MGSANRCASAGEQNGHWLREGYKGVAKRFKTVAIVDKVAKATQRYAEAAKQIAIAANASEGTVQKLDNTATFFKISRLGIALTNIFRGVLEQIYDTCSKIIRLAKALFRGRDEDKKAVEATDSAVGRKEMAWLLASSAGGLIGATTYTFAFAAPRPAYVYGKMIDHSCTSAQKFGRIFPTVMMVNHVGTTISSACGWKFLNLQKNRLMDGIPVKERSERQLTYKRNVRDHKIILVEKGLEMCNDVIYHWIPATPPLVQGLLGATIGTVSLVKVLLKNY